MSEQTLNTRQHIALGFWSHLQALHALQIIIGKAEAGQGHWRAPEGLVQAGQHVIVLALELGYDPSPIQNLVFFNDRSQLDEVLMLADRIMTGVQVSAPAPSLHHEKPQSPVFNDGEFNTAQWFSTETKIPSSRLRHAANHRRKTKRVRAQDIDGVTCYSVDDAYRWWPQDMPNR